MSNIMRYLTAVLIVCLILSCNTITERMPHFDIHGIDVSHYQAKVNWDSIASQNINFAFVKATEGETHVDSLFLKNWSEIKRVGMKRGAYHFFRPKISASKQASNFIKHVQLKEGDLPPVLDVEVSDGVSDEALLTSVQVWVEAVENHYGVRPIIYTNLKFFNRIVEDNFDNYPIWIARYNTREPYLGYKRDWTFWQYGNRGQLNGIKGFVDFKVFRGTQLGLEAMCISDDPMFSNRN